MKITVPEAARRVGRNPETIRRWIWSGKLPSEKVGTQHLVDLDRVDALAAKRSPAPTPAQQWEAWDAEVQRVNEEFPASFRGIDVIEAIRLTREGH
jgi:excisionase family DNA binding protein